MLTNFINNNENETYYNKRIRDSIIELANALAAGVSRAYSAVSNPVEGTILTVFRESAEYTRANVTEQTTAEQMLELCVVAGNAHSPSALHSLYAPCNNLIAFEQGRHLFRVCLAVSL